MSNIEERPVLLIDLFEVQKEWEWQEYQKKQELKQCSEETVIVIDI